MKLCYIDLETFSTIPLKSGVYKYAEAVEIMLFAYAIDDGPVSCWDLTLDEVPPKDLTDALSDPNVLVIAHNFGFEAPVLDKALPSFLPPIERRHCTMARALAHSLPGSLDKLCEVFNLPEDQRKRKEGRDLVMLFCRPQPEGRKIQRATRHTHPIEWVQFVEYAKYDIVSMRELYRLMPRWNYQGVELELWRLDAKINARGIAVDLDLCARAITAVEKEKRRLAKRTHELTNGEVDRTTQRDKLLAHLLAEHGVELPDMQASTLERRLADESLPSEVRELIIIRLQASTSSTSKYSAVMRSANDDGRLRGMLQFCGAGRTGRWSGRIVQLQNLPRSTLPQEEIDLGITAIKSGCEDIVVDNIMETASNALRGFIVAPPGYKFDVSDLANIESRFGAWVADERWKLQAFRDYDAGVGPDLYNLAYARAFAVSHTEVSKLQRQIGKVMELFLLFEGGVGAFITGADTYSIDLKKMTDAAMPSIPADVLEESRDFLNWRYTDVAKRYQKRMAKGEIEEAKRLLELDKETVRYGLTEEVFIACDALKRLWRRQHPAIVQFWKDIKEAVIHCINNPGEMKIVGRVRVIRQANWLRIILPSGRSLSYPAPRVENNAISYMGVNPYTKQWSRIKTYGGKFLENICQGGSRDVMGANMPAIETAGYAIVMHTHDELITETNDQCAVKTPLTQMMATQPVWGDGLPLAASGYEARRYRKE